MSMKGVNLFLVVKPIQFPNPLPQRFAVKLNRQGTCNWLEHRFSFYQLIGFSDFPLLLVENICLKNYQISFY